MNIILPIKRNPNNKFNFPRYLGQSGYCVQSSMKGLSLCIFVALFTKYSFPSKWNIIIRNTLTWLFFMLWDTHRHFSICSLCFSMKKWLEWIAAALYSAMPHMAGWGCGEWACAKLSHLYQSHTASGRNVVAPRRKLWVLTWFNMDYNKMWLDQLQLCKGIWTWKMLVLGRILLFLVTVLVFEADSVRAGK